VGLRWNPCAEARSAKARALKGSSRPSGRVKCEPALGHDKRGSACRIFRRDRTREVILDRG